MSINLVEQGGGVAADDFQFAQRTHVDEADALADRAVLAVRRGVRERPPPVAEQPHIRAEFQMAVVERSPFLRVMSAAGQHSERDGFYGRARGGGARRGQFMTGLPGTDAQRGRGAHASLAGSHAERTVTFQRFDFVEALGHANDQVGVGHVFAQTDELLFLDLDVAELRGRRLDTLIRDGFAMRIVRVRGSVVWKAPRGVPASRAPLIEHG